MEGREKRRRVYEDLHGFYGRAGQGEQGGEGGITLKYASGAL